MTIYECPLYNIIYNQRQGWNKTIVEMENLISDFNQLNYNDSEKAEKIEEQLKRNSDIRFRHVEEIDKFKHCEECKIWKEIK